MRKLFILLIIIALMSGQVGFILAQGMPDIPACQFSGQPTSEQIAACQAAAQQAAPSQVPAGTNITGVPSMSDVEAIAGQAGIIKGPSAKDLEKPLAMIKEGLIRAQMGYAKSKDMGVDVTQADHDLLEQAHTAYKVAQANFEAGDFTAAASSLQEMQKMNLQEKFQAFKAKAMPDSRQVEVLGQIGSGIKALELTIAHAKDYGIDTAELEDLLGQVKVLSEAASAAHSAKDLEGFLSSTLGVEDLNINDKVNAIIKKLANEKTKDLVVKGVDKLTKATDDIRAGIDIMTKQKVDVVRSNELLNKIILAITEAKTKLEAGDNIAAGKKLDDAVESLIPLGNILKDNGVKLASGQMADLNAALNSGKNVEGLTIAENQNAKALGVMNAVRPEDIPVMKGTMMEFSPELMDRVIGARDKDKNFIDAIMRDVMPLIPEKDRQKTLEGSLGLIEESKNADRTISQLKQMKQLPTAIVTQMTQVRDQVKSYNFTPALSQKLDGKLSDFNDQVQTGQIKSVAEIKSAVENMKTEVAKAMTEANQQKFRQGIIPARNIDTSNALFDEVNYLKVDGAIKTDKAGNINLAKLVTQADLAVLINNTIDKKEVAPSVKKQNVMDVLRTTFAAYDVKPVNLSKPAEVMNFMKTFGVDMKPADLNKPATLGMAADIVAEADQRWGAN